MPIAMVAPGTPVAATSASSCDCSSSATAAGSIATVSSMGSGSVSVVDGCTVVSTPSVGASDVATGGEVPAASSRTGVAGSVHATGSATRATNAATATRGKEFIHRTYEA
jgi:hypothetical protein